MELRRKTCIYLHHNHLQGRYPPRDFNLMLSWRSPILQVLLEDPSLPHMSKKSTHSRLSMESLERRVSCIAFRQQG